MEGRLLRGSPINPFAWVPCPTCNGEGGNCPSCKGWGVSYERVDSRPAGSPHADR